MSSSSNKSCGKSLGGKTFAEMYNAKRKSMPTLSPLRRQKIQFFTQQVIVNQSSQYGTPGSDSWISGVVQFLNCETVTPEVVKFWLAREPSLLKASPDRAATRMRTNTPITPSHRHGDILNLGSRTSSDEPSYPESWYDFFKPGSSQNLPESSTANSSGAGIFPSSSMAELPDRVDFDLEHNSTQNVIQHQKTDDIQHESPNEDIRPELPEDNIRPELPEEDIRPELPEEDIRPELPEEDIRPELPEEDIRPELPEEDIRPELPEEDIGQELPEEDIGQELPEEDIGQELPEEDIGQELPEEDIGQELPEEDIGQESLDEDILRALKDDGIHLDIAEEQIRREFQNEGISLDILMGEVLRDLLV